jgi:L-serine dehydratase
MKTDYETAKDLVTMCEADGLSLGEAALRREAAAQGVEEAILLKQMRGHNRTMKESIRRGLEICRDSPSRLSEGDAQKSLAYSASEKPFLGPHFARTMAYGFAVLETNAQFGRIVATPTAGSAGIVPACLLTLEEAKGLNEDAATIALFTAAGIGVVIGKNALVFLKQEAVVRRKLEAHHA